MPAGDIKISTLKCGDLDLTTPKDATYGVINIHEHILNMYGPAIDIEIIDYNDALGKYKLNGSYDKDIEIKFSVADTGKNFGFKFKFFQNKNVSDMASQNKGSLHSKQYQIRGVSKELLNAQGNYVSKSYEELTSKMVEDILKNNFKTDKKVEIMEATKGKRRFVFSNEHPLKALLKLNNDHVAQESKSSAYVLFQRVENGNSKYIFSTFEKLFKQSPVIELKQTTLLDYGSLPESDKQKAILKFDVPDSFFTPVRSFEKAQQKSYNPTTGQIDEKQKKNKFELPGKEMYNEVSYANSVPVATIKDPANDKISTGLTEARKNRAQFISHLSQNYASLEVVGNPDIKLGSMINLKIPKRNNEGSANETQFNGKALVVSIKHKIKYLSERPRYTMELGLVKGSFNEGGGENG